MKLNLKNIILASFFIIVASSTYGQSIKKEQLLNTWKLNTYVIKGKKYPPTKKEKHDFISFKSDMSFVSKTEGKEEQGTFMLNINGSYVELIDAYNNKLKATITSLTQEKLVLIFDIKELREVEVHYKKIKASK